MIIMNPSDHPPKDQQCHDTVLTQIVNGYLNGIFFAGAHNDGYCESVVSLQLRGDKRWRTLSTRAESFAQRKG